MTNEKWLIDANALIKAIKEESWKRLPMIQMMLEYINMIIREQPNVDAVEVVHGRWIEDSDLCTITCSECGKLWCILDNDTDTFNYCPNCGAKMDADDLEE